MPPSKWSLVPLGLARQARDGAGRLGHGVAERADQNELAFLQKIDDLAIRPRPEDARSDDEQARLPEIGRGVELRQSVGAAANPREPDALRTQPRGDPQAHHVRERVTPRGAVAGRLFRRRPDEALPIPVIELPGREAGQPGGLGRGKTPGHDSAEFHGCNSQKC